jgi:hypothetical protein
MAGSAKRGAHQPQAVSNGGSPISSQQNGSPALDRVIQAQIGDKLRAMYGELTEQPVPDRLTSILAQLGAKAGGESGS